MVGDTTFRQLLEDGDVNGLRRHWASFLPGMPQPETFEQAQITMHLARTASTSVAFRFRAYSHRWLEERGLPSQLPDNLKPKAERIYPRVVEGVVVSVNFRSAYLQTAADEVRASINDAIEDCYAERKTDAVFVRRQMDAARHRTMKALFG